MNTVEIRNMTKVFKGFSIENLSLDIRKGCITGLIGKNGAGKTTIIKAIAGAINIDSGEISVFGKPLKGNEIEIKKRIGVALDDGHFYNNLTAKAMKNMIKPFYPNWDDDLFDSYMERFNLPPDKKINQLSKGMRAKLNIALTLAHHPKLLIMDEPSAGLDPMAREDLMDILGEIMEDAEITVLLSTHITSDLDRTADYIIIVDDGRIVLQGEKDEIIDSHRLIKGGELTSDMERYFVRCKKGRYGFEAMTNDPDGFRKKFPDCVIEKPLIEDIMRAYVGN